jgi:hypothetical protein
MVSQNAPCRLWQIGISIGQEALAAGFPRKHYRTSFVDMQMDERRRKDWSGFRNFARLGNRQKKLVILGVCPEFRSKPV